MRLVPVTFLARALTLAACTAVVAACGAASNEDEAVGESATEAYTGTLPGFRDINPLPGSPASWAQPASEGIFNQYGYCGATAAANLLKWYAKSVSPQQAIDGGCWSYVGTFPSTLGNYMATTYPKLGCKYKTMSYDVDALQALKNSLASGHPVAIEFMTGSLNAHWMVIVGVLDRNGKPPQVVAMTDGKYRTTNWSELQDAWRHGWGGYYPHVSCDAVSPQAKLLLTR